MNKIGKCGPPYTPMHNESLEYIEGDGNRCEKIEVRRKRKGGFQDFESWALGKHG
jgi:hypothetical protein